MQDLNADLAAAFSVKTRNGVIVTRVERGSPADLAGLREGDIVQRVGARDIDQSSDYHSQAAVMFIGDDIDFHLIRDGRKRRITLTISEESQQQIFGRQLHPRLEGVVFENFRSPDAPETSAGVLVTGVDSDSAAYGFGMRAGDIIVQLNRSDVQEIAELRDVLQSANRRLVFRIYRNGRFGTLQIR